MGRGETFSSKLEGDADGRGVSEGKRAGGEDVGEIRQEGRVIGKEPGGSRAKHLSAAGPGFDGDGGSANMDPIGICFDRGDGRGTPEVLGEEVIGGIKLGRGMKEP